MTKPRPFGHYFILEKIAQGGMAEIFKGLTYDFSGLKKFIVIKRILPHIAANEAFIRMLIDEAKIAVRLNHGNIAQTFDLGKVAEDYFIVMEYVEGYTISQLYKKALSLKESIPLPMISYVVSEICNGLDYIHRRNDESGRSLGIVHCDISPQNIIVSSSGTVKIVDFGVAKAAFKLSERDRGVLKGKFAYMSPEQTEGIHVDARSDIFSTGVVLWEILTSRRLFKKKNNTETIESVNTMKVYPPSAYRNEIPSELDEIVMKALKRDPDRRYETAADLSLALTKFNLKHYPEFKAAQIGDFINQLFDDEEHTGDLLQEKTQHEELTVREVKGKGAANEKENTPAEDTVIVDPQELDFHSIFDEIEMDDVSEVTQAIDLIPNPQAGAPLDDDEPTGDVPGEEPAPQIANIGEILDENLMDPLAEPSLKKRALIAVGLIAFFVLIYLSFVMFLSDASSRLELSFVPKGSQAFFNGKPLVGAPPISLEGLQPRTKYKIRLLHEGYHALETEVYLWPAKNKKLNLSLKRLESGLIEVISTPSEASIYIDGRITGRTTPTIFESRKLKFPLLISLNKAGYPQWSQKIESLPKTNLKVQADLKIEMATLEILSKPNGASVYIDNDLLGKTPLYSLKVPSQQNLKIRLEKEGFQQYHQEIRLKSGQQEKLGIVMRK